MAKSLVVKVQSRVLKWLRISSGWKIDEAAEKLSIEKWKVLNLESGKEYPRCTTNPEHILARYTHLEFE